MGSSFPKNEVILSNALACEVVGCVNISFEKRLRHITMPPTLHIKAKAESCVYIHTHA